VAQPRLRARSRWLLAGLGLSLVLASSSASHADGPDHAAAARRRTPAPQVPIGFSKLVVRLDSSDEIGIAATDFHVRMIEHMRERGFDAVGAENLVFGKDESRRAEYLVGGTVREVECREHTGLLSCSVGVEWQLLDVERDQVVYTVMDRVAVIDDPVAEKDRMAGRLLDRAMDALLDRPRFRAALKAHDDAASAPASPFAPATIKRCAPGRRVPDSADDLLRSVVVVKEKSGFGSGFFVSPEGLVITAAHVVDGSRIALRLRDGTEMQAVPVRIAPREDVALLRTETPLSGQPCAALRADTPTSGAEVYAVGAPASLDLAFSLTRGIVSGMPVIDGRRRLQTDAPVNPGNSGGPIADVNGAVVGVVSFKIVAQKVEGLAFAVPTPEALSALGLRVGDGTDAGLLTDTAPVAAAPKPALFKDAADPVQSLDPEGDERERERERERREQQRKREAEQERERRTPIYVPAMRYTGVVVAVLGALTVAGTAISYSSTTTTEAQFDSLRTWNTVGWVGVAGGATAFGLSFVLRPPPVKPAVATWVEIDGRGLRWHGTF
jgi:S1-C subfamily serine protease